MQNKVVKKYEWVLFDADETLFHFDAFNGLKLMFSRYKVIFTTSHFEEYQTLNLPLWANYQNGLVTAHQVQTERFNFWANKLNVTTEELNLSFQAAMAEICKPLPGAISLIQHLHGKSKLGIITNGFTSLQKVRLEKTGLQNHFDLLVISEQVGLAKPHIGIFEHALEIMGHPDREKVLMVGDNFEADIHGGHNAGFDTCWLNADKKPAPLGIQPTYQVSSLHQLKTLLHDTSNSE